MWENSKQFKGTPQTFTEGHCSHQPWGLLDNHMEMISIHSLIVEGNPIC